MIVGPRQVGKTTLVTQLLPQLSIGSHLIKIARLQNDTASTTGERAITKWISYWKRTIKQ